ncbi:beta-N-acetylhexosaminidase [Pedobacter frigiditerrae]|uniref:beta-N-acetylhexosaminidase n=1 Tax=Pedobacter frigiditerrae TaxID=2530452 RepID=A0A4R0MS89_9SPHI|nr:beta-N-acetylhexosaminidase [Pedobacter frigiditerrae]TCC89517.1 beta-N-acetylhexosaminidase [Pedobacter frigiditerrae]
MKKFIFCFLLFAFSFSLSAQEVNIIPRPVELRAGLFPEDTFTIDKNTAILITAEEVRNSAQFLADYIEKIYNLKLEVTSNPDKKSKFITLVVNKKLYSNPNKYFVSVLSSTINAGSSSEQGIFYAIQSIIQLLPTKTNDKLTIPSVDIIDYPRFEYRAMHLDVSRHFFDVATVKKYIDYLALHKMNYFHWHLTDDHGWRIEIKKYPKLTEVGAWRNGSIIGLWPGKGNEGIKYEVFPTEIKITPKDAVIKTDGIKHGGYYTQEEIKDVIDYAKKRYITIIPEIEMPAHSMALLAAYPELGTEPNKKYEVAQTWGMMNKYNNVLAPTEKTFSFLEDVLMEVMQLFPSQYIHIGGDEASKVWWKQDPVTQQMMKANHLKDESALQSYFIHRIEKFVNSQGKTIIGWDEILDGGLAPNAIVMSWRGEKGGIAAAKLKQKVIMTPEDITYFNHKQFLKDDSLAANKYLPLESVYNYEPVPSELNADQAKYVWGAQGNLWSEYVANPKKIEYQIFPRLDALSEILWSPKQGKNYPDFLKRLKTQFKRYDLMGITYSKKYLEN